VDVCKRVRVMTPEEMAACAAQGRYWFMSGATYYGSATATPQSGGDIYLGDFPPSWVAQWEDWEQAAAAMEAEGLFARLNEFRERNL
jgi:hypothetical protein